MIVPITAVGLGQVWSRFFICVCIIKCLFLDTEFRSPKGNGKKVRNTEVSK